MGCYIESKGKEMVNWIRCNFSVLRKYFFVYCSAIFALLQTTLIFVSFEDFGIDTKPKKLMVLLVCVLISTIISITIVRYKNKKQIFGDINRGLTIRYDDIIKLAFDDTNLKEKIVVIPVNRCFDLSCDNNLINPISIHGQWINKYIISETQKNILFDEISNMLANNYETLSIDEKRYGSLKRYPPGTIAEIKGENNTTFYLLALSSFDKNLKAQCSELEYYNTITGLIEYYDSHGNGKELFCPIMGDHIVNPFRNTESVIDFMISIFKFNRRKIRGKINLVVYNKIKSKISILNY